MPAACPLLRQGHERRATSTWRAAPITPALWPELYAAMQAVKAAFDPDNLMNPGKIDSPRPPESLRFGPDYATLS